MAKANRNSLKNEREKMYTIEWAKNFSGFAKDEQLDMQQFVAFYEEYITNRMYFHETGRGFWNYFYLLRRNQ